MSKLLAILGLADGFSWLGVLKLALTLADKLADIVRARQLMDAGEAKATAKQLIAIADRLGITEHIRAEVAALPDADIDKELSGTDQL